jgi:hypothetical protein
MGDVVGKPVSKRVRGKAAKADAAVAAMDSKPIPGAHIERQAIVVVHGQGQQRPMGTIRDFVNVLWRRDPDLGSLPMTKVLPGQVGKDNEDEGREVWIVPDDKGGLFELQRVTTPEFPDPDKNRGRPGRRTDFFELYYADLLDDTPIRNLWLWAQRLMSIRPRDLTARMVWPWLVFWLLSVAIAALTVIVVLHIPALLHEDWVTPLLGPNLGPSHWVIVVCVVTLLLRRLLPLPDLLRAGFVSFALIVIILVSLSFIYERPRLELFGATFRIFPLAAALLVLAYFLVSFLLPLFGDAASYLSAQTETVRSRQAVRERGLKLLRRLHAEAEYQRIVIIAHSLGTALAYDLLHILWQEVGPTKDNPPGPEALAALVRVDDHTRQVEQRLDEEEEQLKEQEELNQVEALKEKQRTAKAPRRRPQRQRWTTEDVLRHQELQWDAFDLLRQGDGKKAGTAAGQPDIEKPAGWKVSDFISLGSPLASAQFLVADGDKDFARLKRERVLPTAPPQPYEQGEQAVHGGVAMHHAAVFSVVRWTNIYDEFNPVLLAFGDVISGPVSGPRVFGDAVLDRRVKVLRSDWLVFNRFFTHGHYWIEPRKDGGVSKHVKVFRDAVGLYRGMELPRT